MKLHLLLSLLIGITCLPGEEDPSHPISTDGWAESSTLWNLHQPSEVATLVVRATIPNGIESTSAQVKINDSITQHPACSAGTIELRQILVGGVGPKEVSLIWDKKMQLPAPDKRIISARILWIGFEPLSPIPSSWTVESDVISAGGNIAIGTGWYGIETWQGQHFRWMGKSGEIALAPVIATKENGTLTIDMEPGPGTGGNPAQIRLEDRDGNLVDKINLTNRMHGDLVISALALKKQPLKLRVSNGGTKISGDPRLLDLRVFSFHWSN